MDLSRWHRNRAPRSPAHLRSPSTASAPDATSRQSPASPTTRRPGGAPGTRGWERGRVPGLRAGSASAARGDGPGLQEALRGLTRRCRARRVGPTSPPPLRLRGQQARLGAAHLVSKGCGSSLCTFSACLISSEVAPAFPGCWPRGALCGARCWRLLPCSARSTLPPAQRSAAGPCIRQRVLLGLPSGVLRWT